MIGKFLHGMGFNRSRASRSSADRPAGNSHRRLAVEPIEDRLLLSATGGESVADGGAVWLTVPGSRFEAASLDAQFETEVVRSVDKSTGTNKCFDPTCGSYPESSSSEAVSQDTLSETEVPRSVYSIERLDAPCWSFSGNGFSHAMPQTVAPSDTGSIFLNDSADVNSPIAQPKSEELVPEDLAPSQNETGMIDLAYMARQKVFAEVDSSREMLNGEDLLEWRSKLELAEEASPTFEQNIEVGASHKSTVALAGSRGRLAAFDLAIREHISDWRTDLGTSESSSPTDDSHIPASVAPSSRTGATKPTDLSSLPLHSEHPLLDLDTVVHDLALTDVFALSTSCQSAGSTSQAMKQSEPVGGHTAAVQDRPDAQDAVKARAVYPDQRREKPVAHLVVAAGIGHVLVGNRRQTAADHEYEQLPPRKR